MLDEIMNKFRSATNDSVELARYIPADLTRGVVLCAPEAGFRPIDGKFPLHPFTFSGWENEELSWYDNCYIHAGLNPMVTYYHAKGEDCLKLLEAFTVSTFKNFPVGKARHAVFCTENGKIALDGIVIRRSEDEFIGTSVLDFNLMNQLSGNKYRIRCENRREQAFFFQLCGPRSLEIVEAAAREDLHDIGFMYSRDARIAGKEVFVLRTGMAGTLGYEVHGKNEDALTVYKKLLEVGAAYGITEIGRHAYRNAHTEGSIPQGSIHFGFAHEGIVNNVYGSLEQDSELVTRSPFDVGWGKLVSFNHEFPGKEALMKEHEGHHNACVHLVWNPEDILKVVATYFEKGNSCDVMDMVEDYDYMLAKNAMRIDAVYDGEKLIGAASGRMLSPKTREMISLCTIDEDYAVEGREVEVLWGNPGTRQMRIRATVTLFPYIKECRNDSFDVEAIPHPRF